MSHEHIKIYSTVPFNTGESKYPDLTPYREDWGPMEALDASFNPFKRRNDMLGPNTAQRKLYIKKGYISENYDDEPYIVPFLCKGSKEAVLIVPGGAYQDVSLDGEGYPTGEMLQKLGINAFVLKYRVYPYKYPCAQLDCRRALCYLKYHSKEFGFDSDKLSIIGFSAGGNLAATTTYLFKDMPVLDGYKQDDIDKLDPTPKTLGLIYSELLADNFLMSLQFGDRLFNDKEYAEKIHKEQYIPSYVDANSPPVFLCCSIDDCVVSPDNVLTMAKACKDANVKYEVHMFSEGGHGYGCVQEDIPPMYGLEKRRMAGTRDWIRLYDIWLKKMIYTE